MLGFVSFRVGGNLGAWICRIPQFPNFTRPRTWLNEAVGFRISEFLEPVEGGKVGSSQIRRFGHAEIRHYGNSEIRKLYIPAILKFRNSEIRNSEKYIFKFVQIHLPLHFWFWTNTFEIWTNTCSKLDNYILQIVIFCRRQLTTRVMIQSCCEVLSKVLRHRMPVTEIVFDPVAAYNDILQFRQIHFKFGQIHFDQVASKKKAFLSGPTLFFGCLCVFHKNAIWTRITSYCQH